MVVSTSIRTPVSGDQARAARRSVPSQPSTAQLLSYSRLPMGWSSRRSMGVPSTGSTAPVGISPSPTGVYRLAGS